ncbi:MAG: hypothetical protein VB119_04170 [Candidatus Metalachnospira sp.]|nr:hypothetical protein [Candidatus Metalachnospira sp.]
MSIIWRYLDKRSAAVDALKDLSSMKFIIDHTDDEMKNTYEKMYGVSSPQFDGMPRVNNPKAGEERILRGIEEIDVLKERYRQAAEYMEWFGTAWNELTEDEQYVLTTFYDEAASQTGAVYAICDYYHIERSSAYNKKNRALQHLTTLLFGKA